jgi:hypothetical protein
MKINRVESVGKIQSEFPRKLPQETEPKKNQKSPEELPVDTVDLSDEALRILKEEKEQQ